MKKYKIQEEIVVDQEWINKLIEKYQKMPEKIGMGFGNFSGGKKEIIQEIKDMTENGQRICLMEYRFQEDFPKMLKDFEKTPFGKAGKELKELLEKKSNEMVEVEVTGKPRVGMSSLGVNISQVFDEELAKITDKNMTEICKKEIKGFSESNLEYNMRLHKEKHDKEKTNGKK